MTNQRESNETSSQSQSDKFKKAAKEHDADPSVKRWDERLKKLIKPSPTPRED